MMHIDIKDWDGEVVVTRYIKRVDTWVFIAIHSTKIGPPTGGTRFLHYTSPKHALQDALRLSRGMTYKFAYADFPRGGAKAVLAVPRILSLADRNFLLTEYGKIIKDLNGLFYTGPDVGTSSDDMDVLAKVSPDYVFSKSIQKGGAGHSGLATARGVHHAMEAAIKQLLPDKCPSIFIQGLGSVGHELLNQLMKQSFQLLATDIDNSKLTVLPLTVKRINTPFHWKAARSDVYSPNALGGVITTRNINKLDFKIIVGAANNQLEYDELAETLFKRGIWYLPDFTVNAGGAMAITGKEALQWTGDQVSSCLEGIGTRTEALIRLCLKTGRSPLYAANEVVQSRL